MSFKYIKRLLFTHFILRNGKNVPLNNGIVGISVYKYQWYWPWQNLAFVTQCGWLTEITDCYWKDLLACFFWWHMMMYYSTTSKYLFTVTAVLIGAVTSWGDRHWECLIISTPHIYHGNHSFCQNTIVTAIVINK